MKSALLIAVVCIAVCGCKPNAEPAQAPGQTTTPKTMTQGASATNAGGNDSSTVAPIGPNIGPMTPVAGGENLSSGPGAAGQMAKEQAKKAAAQSSAPAGTGDTSE